MYACSCTHLNEHVEYPDIPKLKEQNADPSVDRSFSLILYHCMQVALHVHQQWRVIDESHRLFFYPNTESVGQREQVHPPQW